MWGKSKLNGPGRQAGTEKRDHFSHVVGKIHKAIFWPAPGLYKEELTHSWFLRGKKCWPFLSCSRQNTQNYNVTHSWFLRKRNFDSRGVSHRGPVSVLHLWHPYAGVTPEGEDREEEKKRRRTKKKKTRVVSKSVKLSSPHFSFLSQTVIGGWTWWWWVTTKEHKSSTDKSKAKQSKAPSESQTLWSTTLDSEGRFIPFLSLLLAPHWINRRKTVPETSVPSLHTHMEQRSFFSFLNRTLQSIFFFISISFWNISFHLECNQWLFGTNWKGEENVQNLSNDQQIIDSHSISNTTKSSWRKQNRSRDARK